MIASISLKRVKTELRQLSKKFRETDVVDTLLGNVDNNSLHDELRWSPRNNDWAVYHDGKVYTFEDGSCAYLDSKTLLVASDINDLSAMFGY